MIFDIKFRPLNIVAGSNRKNMAKVFAMRKKVLLGNKINN